MHFSFFLALCFDAYVTVHTFSRNIGVRDKFHAEGTQVLDELEPAICATPIYVFLCDISCCPSLP